MAFFWRLAFSCAFNYVPTIYKVPLTDDEGVLTTIRLTSTARFKFGG
ncbi:hypothetical protein J2X77_001654 [Sphingobacterium sp. 2149]|nr:hypothetical protein [Sphingobacterium sp. 2149]